MLPSVRRPRSNACRWDGSGHQLQHEVARVQDKHDRNESCTPHHTLKTLLAKHGTVIIPSSGAAA